MDEETKYCRHSDCVADTLQELMALYNMKKRADCLDAAMRVRSDNAEVRCRHVPRRGRVNAPFAPRKEV